jgi:hypothetical protein
VHASGRRAAVEPERVAGRRVGPVEESLSELTGVGEPT